MGKATRRALLELQAKAIKGQSNSAALQDTGGQGGRKTQGHLNSRASCARLRCTLTNRGADMGPAQ
eukprot:10086036-Prorocentrum_lima.AAC.1